MTHLTAIVAVSWWSGTELTTSASYPQWSKHCSVSGHWEPLPRLCFQSSIYSIPAVPGSSSTFSAPDLESAEVLLSFNWNHSLKPQSEQCKCSLFGCSFSIGLQEVFFFIKIKNTTFFFFFLVIVLVGSLLWTSEMYLQAPDDILWW